MRSGLRRCGAEQGLESLRRKEVRLLRDDDPGGKIGDEAEAEMEGGEDDEENASEREIPTICASEGSADPGNHAARARAKEFRPKARCSSGVGAGWGRDAAKAGSRFDRRSAAGAETRCLRNFFAALCAVHRGLRKISILSYVRVWSGVPCY